MPQLTASVLDTQTGGALVIRGAGCAPTKLRASELGDLTLQEQRNNGLKHRNGHRQGTGQD